MVHDVEEFLYCEVIGETQKCVKNGIPHLLLTLPLLD